MGWLNGGDLDLEGQSPCCRLYVDHVAKTIMSNVLDYPMVTELGVIASTREHW